jgi:hydroxymethylpyrimidine/phosphomethylpyrimidine kinase
MKTVLCIGGLDPAGRAGLLADAAAVHALGARPLCVATALTFQSSIKVDGFEAVAPDIVRRQIEVLLRDEQVDAVKIGQLASAGNAAVVLGLPPELPIVLDTPLIASSGAALFPLSEIGAYAPLVSRATLVTPNATEVLLLTRASSPAERAPALAAARRLDAKAVLLKGGHLPGAEVEDVLLRGGEEITLRSPRLSGRFRGTGCRLASAIAVGLAEGRDLRRSARDAHEWLHQQLVRESSGT